MSWCLRSPLRIPYSPALSLRLLSSGPRTASRGVVRSKLIARAASTRALQEHKSMFRHVVLLTVNGDADVDRIVRELNALPAVIPELLSYSAGRDAGVSSGNASIAVVADFRNIQDYEQYRDNAEHQRIIAQLIKPFSTGRTAVQYEVPAEKVQGGPEGTK